MNIIPSGFTAVFIYIKPDFDYLLALRETKTLVRLPENRCNLED
ncbi:hypothetical protein PN480_16720 [Dolichospermum circinale CS-1225]|nr:hypothetical protein [Dolichospermum circinale]MDB9471606.1 hypothetical protein [Dolichospermum circinale CS-539]MDB9523576.1 hypothetical protein [Dolichospermum circinale CS-1225]